MRNVEWKSRQGPVCHPIYDREEADEIGVPYSVDPRVGPQEGRWILTDDGKVVQILKAGPLGGGGSWIRTCTGTFNTADKKTIIDTLPRASRYTLGGAQRPTSHVTPAPEWEQFGILLAMGKGPDEAYRACYPGAHAPAYVREASTKLMRKPEVQLIVAEKIEEVLKALNIDNRFILGRYKELAENADSDAVSIAALNSLSRIVGIMDMGQKKGQGVISFVGLSNEQLAAIEASQTRAVDYEEVPTLQEPLGSGADGVGDAVECVEDG
jgi:hypothetical protein